MSQDGAGLAAMAHEVLHDLAILGLLDAGMAGESLRDGLRARGLPGDAARVDAAVRRLAREGFLRPGDAPGTPHAVTAAGRRARDRIVADFARVGSELAGEVPATPGDGAGRAALDEERAELERLRADFLATVSHELRTPLTLIRTSIGLLLDGTPDAALRERLLRNIKRGADRMQALVADLLDLARLRRGQVALNLRRVDLGELSREVAALMQPLFDEKGQALAVVVPEPAPAVLGDARRLEWVLLNLLANAHMFAPGGSRVSVVVAPEGAGATVAVADEGPGIASEAQARLWEQFYTGRTSSSSHDIGVGLGLPIARGIVEAHGGRIWVQSAAGRGSTFVFALPAEPPGAGEAE